MAGTQQAQQAPQRYMQGIAVPASSVRPTEFFARTRRHTTLESTRTFTGLGGQDVFELRKSDILAGAYLKFSGSLTVTTPTGSVVTTARWPYDLVKQLRFTANGQSNIINVSGLKLKARQFMARDNRNDRGIAQTVNGGTVNQGTFSDASEKWGVGSQTGVTAGTYQVELEFFIPVAEDQVDLAGAIFAATSSTDLTVTVDYAQQADLFTVTGTATATLTGSVQLVSLKYSIPIGNDGQIVVPDLSTFHSLIQSRQASGLANAENEVRLVGQGAGKSLLRCFYQVWNGTTPAPLAMTAANFGKQSWRYAGNETPDEYYDGQLLRVVNEAIYNNDMGGVWGFGCHEFAAENAFRDVVDMGTTSELRLVTAIQNAVTLQSPAIEYVTETIFTAGAGA